MRNSRCAVNATNGTQAMNPFLPVRHSFPVVMRCKEKHPEQTGAACGKSRSSAEGRVRGEGWTRPGGGRRAGRPHAGAASRARVCAHFTPPRRTGKMRTATTPLRGPSRRQAPWARGSGRRTRVPVTGPCGAGTLRVIARCHVNPILKM